eukprot:GHVQ01012759.1.p1 GENE.GHVQ01012759.1~~GHVQ01012759.1.p1  ORF type:complete len:151 (-),score=10.11 GHVQ01012759.1:31-483(-)
MTSIATYEGLTAAGYIASRFELYDMISGKTVLDKTIPFGDPPRGIEPGSDQWQFVNFIQLVAERSDAAPSVIACSNDSTLREYSLWGQEKVKYKMYWAVNHASASPDKTCFLLTGDHQDAVIVDRRAKRNRAVLKVGSLRLLWKEASFIR